MAEAHRALQGVDRLLVAEDVGDEAVGLVLVELGAVDLFFFFFFFEEKSESLFVGTSTLDEVFSFSFSIPRKRTKKERKTKRLTVTIPAESCPRCCSISSPS